MSQAANKHETGMSFQPLYAQVKTVMTQRIGSGQWQPGEMIPNEFQLAAEFKVSQGTVRKALIALEADKLIVRQQGRGTYVARHTGEQTLFQFFRMVDDKRERLTPVSRPLSQKQVKATKDLARMLAVPVGEMLHVITRVRHFSSDPAIFERVYIPVVLMPDLAISPGEDMAEEMYVIYQERYRITIANASETLRAVLAGRDEMKNLAVETGTPLLEINRIARDVNGKIVELRISYCKTNHYAYATEVT
ncbi:MAG: GntR family transcriptional regulator [Acidocella sp. 20-57-95]|nr:MAG: GntR family transcriptional regulator [Acidocella sp. 20-57-95]OYV58025.1 MAG: GntR family transcriptional regulator [Acidocella sp. 21-58-7]HQT64530.1 GntR family transcriptional regulator [Acidocella sp.]HQU04337.1 GntR family transcriptional regulator [Acidocella sp.]